MSSASRSQSGSQSGTSRSVGSKLADHIPQQQLIRASAGTGKTYQLSSRYLTLLRQVSPEKILASTFTRKAAGEILERVLVRLAQAAIDPQALKQLGQAVGPPSLTRAECLQMLTRLTHQLHRVRISTLDAFFAQLAGSYALELGMMPGWRILDALEIDQLRSSSIAEMLTLGSQQELVQLMHLLDKGQSSRSVSRLVTETIQNLYDVFLSAPPESWEQFPDHLFLSGAQREELITRLQLFPVEKAGLSKARDKDCERLQDEDWDNLLSSGLMPRVLSGNLTYSRAEIPAGLAECYRDLASHVLAQVAAPWREQTRAARDLLQHFHQVFEQQKQSAGGLEFGDVTRRLAQAQQRSRLSDHSYRLDAAIDHLLLDEFQDTSPGQWNVVRSFAEDACSHPGKSFFCVGDTKQAIYGWRGGEAALFDLIARELPGADSAPIELNVSYRSAPVIMDAVNQIMTGLPEHNNLTEHQDLIWHWSKHFPAHKTAHSSLPGYVCLRTLSDGKSGTGPESEDDDAAPASEFWTEVAQYVRDRHREAPAASIGVLTRRNSSIGRLIFELNQLQVPASEEGGNPLTDSAAVQLVLSLMQLADHPGDQVAACHVARSPLGDILGWTDWQSASSRARFAAQLRARLIAEGYGGLMHSLTAQLAAQCDAREYRRMTQLAALADRYDALHADLRPSAFVEFVQQQRQEEPSSARIRVMNIHQSKGLEFDIVILPELDSSLYQFPKYVSRSPSPGLPPHVVALYRQQQHFEVLGGELLAARQATRDRLFQESLCVLYVALTRAARSLHLLIAPKVSKKHPKSFSGLIRAAVAPQVALQPHQVIWEQGDRDWFKQAPRLDHVPEPTDKPAAAADDDTDSRPIRFASSGSRQILRRLAPSHSPAAAVRFGRTGSSSGSSQGRVRGTLFHRWLQEIEWLQPDSSLPARLEQQVAQLGGSSEESREWGAQFQDLLRSPWGLQLLSRAGYQSEESLFSAAQRQQLAAGTLELQVRNEIPFAIQRSSNTLVSGCIDRLVILKADGKPVAADVIDFKTDNVTTDQDIAECVAGYHDQMIAYHQAVMQLLQLPAGAVTVRLALIQPRRTVVVCGK